MSLCKTYRYFSAYKKLINSAFYNMSSFKSMIQLLFTQ